MNKLLYMNIVKRIVISWLVLCFLLAGFSFIGDCVINYQHAVAYKSVILIYIFQQLAVQIYVTLPIVIVYFLIFRNVANLLYLKVLYFAIILYIACSFLSRDEYNISIGEDGDIKQSITYVLAGLCVLFIDERYLKKKLG